VVAAYLGVAEAGALLGGPVDLTYRGVHVDGDGAISRSCAGRPCPPQRLVEDLVELGDMSEGEAAKEGPERRGCSHAMAEHLGGRGTAHRVGVVDAVAAGEEGLHEGHRLQPDVGMSRSRAQLDIGVEHLAKPQVLGESRRLDEPGVGDRVVVIEVHLDPVEDVRRFAHRKGAFRSGAWLGFVTAILPDRKALFGAPG